MRRTSAKRAAASRKNGRKTGGPKSPQGKEKIHLNALKDGLFSKDIVITSAGERKDDFERLKKEMWELFQPVNALEEMLVADIVENWWRRQRVRRAESAALRNRLDTLWLRDKLELSDKVEGLKVQFLDLVGKHLIAPSSGEDLGPITLDLEEARKQLSSTSLGLEFLMKTMNNIEEEAAAKGQISVESEVLISACCGFANRSARMCRQVNQVSMKVAAEEKAKQEQATGKKKAVSDDLTWEEIIDIHDSIMRDTELFNRMPEFAARGDLTGDYDEALEDFLNEAQSNLRASRKKSLKEEFKGSPAEMLNLVIKSASQSLVWRQCLLVKIEEVEKKTRTEAEIVPFENAPDRFSRAETTIERRMHRALVMLLALRANSDVPKILP